MWFNSFTYAVFLPLVLLAYLLLPLRGRQVMLVGASYLFYCWVTPVYGLLMLLSTVLDYACGMLLDRATRDRARRWILGISLSGNIVLLGYYKYANFFAENLAALLRTLGADAHWDRLNILLPVGISFYTFQTMSYAIQVYRRQIPACRDFLHFALYVSFFPQLVAGPIERATNLLPQLGTYQRVVWEDIAVGLKRIVLGFFRKMVLADRFALCVNHVFQDPANQPTAAIWVAAFAFMCQITYDFAGYSDIAVGSARLFGVRLTENFRRPMMSLSQAEFWARWHITLTSWLRDYLFQPLGGFRKGWQRALLNGWIVLLICGLWHGASWNFVVWGAVEALYISIYYFWRYLSRDVLGLRRETGARLTPLRLLGWALTVLANVLVCGICFRSPNLATMKQMALGLVGAHPGAAQPAQWDVWFFAGLVAVCLIVEFFQEYLDLNGRLRRLPVAVRAALLTALAALIAVLSVNNASPYIYFRF